MRLGGHYVRKESSYKTVSLASGANFDIWQSQHFKLDVDVPGVYYTHNYCKLHMWKCPGFIHCILTVQSIHNTNGAR